MLTQQLSDLDKQLKEKEEKLKISESKTKELQDIVIANNNEYLKVQFKVNKRIRHHLTRRMTDYMGN